MTRYILWRNPFHGRICPLSFIASLPASTVSTVQWGGCRLDWPSFSLLSMEPASAYSFRSGAYGWKRARGAAVPPQIDGLEQRPTAKSWSVWKEDRRRTTEDDYEEEQRLRHDSKRRKQTKRRTRHWRRRTWRGWRWRCRGGGWGRGGGSGDGEEKAYWPRPNRWQTISTVTKSIQPYMRRPVANCDPLRPPTDPPSGPLSPTLSQLLSATSLPRSTIERETNGVGQAVHKRRRQWVKGRQRGSDLGYDRGLNRGASG